MLDSPDLENWVQTTRGVGCGVFGNERDYEARTEMAQQIGLAIEGEPALGQLVNVELGHS